MSKRCCWVQQESSESTFYETGCEYSFVIDGGTPEESSFRYCCFCGRVLQQVLMEEEV